MTRMALIRNGVVDNVIVATPEFAGRYAADHDYDDFMLAGDASAGWLVDGGELVPPPSPEPEGPPPPLTPLEFLRRFTDEERAGMVSSSDPNILNAILMIQVAQDVRVDDPATIQFVQYAEHAQLIAAGRAAEILAA